MAACRQHRQLVLLAATRNGGLVVSRPSALFSRSAEGALCSGEKPFSLRPHRGLGIISPEGYGAGERAPGDRPGLDDGEARDAVAVAGLFADEARERARAFCENPSWIDFTLHRFDDIGAAIEGAQARREHRWRVVIGDVGL